MTSLSPYKNFVLEIWTLIVLRTYEHAFYIRNTHVSMSFTWSTYAKIV
jgi:hypothetical protein